MRSTLLAALIVLMACSTSSPATQGSGNPISPGHAYVIEQVTSDGADVALVPGSQPTIRFDGTTIQIDTGCNTISGSYTVDNETLTVTEAMGTLIGCAEPLARQEQLLGTVAEQTTTLSKDGDRLVLRTNGTTITAR